MSQDSAFFASAPDAGYIAVQAYLDRLDDASTAVLRGEIAKRTGKQTTFGWGPRFLHSTGQYHKGGPKQGLFVQVLADTEPDVEIPGQSFTFNQLKRAQADGDLATLRAHGLKACRVSSIEEIS